MHLTDSTPPANNVQRLHVVQPRKPGDGEIELALRQIVRNPTGQVWRWEDDQHTWYVAFDVEDRNG